MPQPMASPMSASGLKDCVYTGKVQSRNRPWRPALSRQLDGSLKTSGSLLNDSRHFTITEDRNDGAIEWLRTEWEFRQSILGSSIKTRKGDGQTGEKAWSQRRDQARFVSPTTGNKGLGHM